MRNPRRVMAAAVLGFECVVLALMTPVMISVEGVDAGSAVAAGLGSAGAAVVIAGLLRFEWAYWLGFALQLFAVGMGVVVPAMYVLGVVFGALWTTAYVLGRRIDSEQRQHAA
jgi:Protein of unknown function (DUF4233)